MLRLNEHLEGCRAYRVVPLPTPVDVPPILLVSLHAQAVTRSGQPERIGLAGVLGLMEHTSVGYKLFIPGMLCQEQQLHRWSMRPGEACSCPACSQQRAHNPMPATLATLDCKPLAGLPGCPEPPAR